MEEGDFLTRIELVEDYKFKIDFNNVKEGVLMMDEPQPLGGGDYPNAGKFLAAAVGNCLCASLTYCLRRHRAEVISLTAEVSTTLSRNENGRLRITHISVELHPVVSEHKKLDACKEMFEEFCIVTQSVKAGIPVDVNVVEGGQGSL
jgi:uncharacterized OsmC-like protein